MEPQHIILIGSPLALLVISIIHTLKGTKALKIYPPIQLVEVIFREKRASGNSKKSFITKLGGAQNILDIIITNDELWIKTHALFASIAQTNDLLHKVKLSNITSIEKGKKTVIVSFYNQENNITTLELLLKNREKFVKIIRSQMKDNLV